MTRSLSVVNNSNYRSSVFNKDQKLFASTYHPRVIPALVLVLHNRNIHTSGLLFASEPLKPSSKVEETVQALKEKAKEDLEASLTKSNKAAVIPPPKKSLQQKIKEEIIHYYHGFRLLAIDINVSRKLIWRVLNGKELTRRERKLLVRTVGDLFRLIPFSVFIIVPFMELALPLFIKFFPGMLPSTFQTSSDQEDKLKKNFKVKLEMTKFLQQTLDDMAVSSKTGRSSQAAKNFTEFFQKIRTSGAMGTSDEIMKFSKVFEDEITLDNLPRPQLMALCRVLEMNPIGTTNFLRFQLRLKLRSLIADDKMIQREGINSLNVSELQAACRSRGMRALGVSEERLKAQLAQWLDLSLEKKVPPSLLLLTQAFMFPETISTEQKLAATIQALPDVVGTATQAIIGEREGKVDFKTKVEVVKEEIEKIKEERRELQQEEIKTQQIEAEKAKEEIMVDSAPTLMDTMDPALKTIVEEIKTTAIKEKKEDEDVTSQDIATLESALEQKLLFEKETLSELRQEMQEYEEDIHELKTMLSSSKQVEEVKETKAAKRLFKKVNSLISKMDTVLAKLEQEEKKSSDPSTPLAKKAGEDVLRVDELIDSIKKIQGVTESSSLERLSEVLNKLDADRDGLVRVDLLLKMLEIVGDEGVKLNKKQINELVELLDREETLEMELEIIKSLKKGDGLSGLQAELERMRAESEERAAARLAEAKREASTKHEVSPSALPPLQEQEEQHKKKAAVSVASNGPQPEISSTKPTISVVEPTSPSGTPKDLR